MFFTAYNGSYKTGRLKLTINPVPHCSSDKTLCVQKSSGQADLKACLKAYPESDIMRWKLERSEDVYASAQREPLGRGWVRGHKLPPGMGDSVAFGMRTDRDKDPTSTSLARGCIAPVNKDYEVRPLFVNHSVTMDISFQAD